MKLNVPALFVAVCLAPAAAFAKCDKDVKTVFSCQTAKGKVIEVCDAGKTISYSFGLPTAKPEIVVTVPRSQASTSQWEGVGRYMSYSVNIPNGNGVYSVYWAADRMSEKHGIEAGVNVELNKKQVANVKCVGDNIVQNIEGIQLKRAE